MGVGAVKLPAIGEWKTVGLSRGTGCDIQSKAVAEQHNGLVGSVDARILGSVTRVKVALELLKLPAPLSRDQIIEPLLCRLNVRQGQRWIGRSRQICAV